MRSEAALADLATSSPELRSPLAATVCRAGGGDPARLIEFWSGRSPGHQGSDSRYRWELTHARAGDARWCGEPESWSPWRDKDAAVLERDPRGFEERLTLPIAIADGLALLSERAPTDPVAKQLLDETATVARRDLAGYVSGMHAWTDTFALRCLARRPAALAAMRPFAIAIAAAYTTAASEGVVRGSRFPFHNTPLASATAMLAAGLWELGQDVPLIARLVSAVGASVDPETGGFGDGDGAPDVFTTVLAAELLSRIEPDFDPEPAVSFVCSKISADGLVRALGPEAPWLTELTLEWLRASSRDFASRFAWPRMAAEDLDRKTGLPPFSFFVDLCDLAGALPGLAHATSTVVFMDLVGFRLFNNTYGQDMGDAVLHAFAHELELIDDSVAIRDGGDELLLIGAPTGQRLKDQLEEFRSRWPVRFAEQFGQDAPPVTARYLVADATGAQLRHAREVLGREVTALKNVDPDAPRGVRKDLVL